MAVIHHQIVRITADPAATTLSLKESFVLSRAQGVPAGPSGRLSTGLADQTTSIGPPEVKLREGEVLVTGLANLHYLVGIENGPGIRRENRFKVLGSKRSRWMTSRD